jgi:hypothetical protein
MTLHSEAVKEIDLDALRAALAVIQRETVRAGGVSFSDGRDLIATHAAVSAALAGLTTRRARDAEVAELVEKGIALIDRYQRDDEDVISRFERLAAMFQSDTGFMAPGKDTSAAAYAGEEYERQREDCWNAWCLEPIKRFRAALLPFQRSGDKGDAT